MLQFEVQDERRELGESVERRKRGGSSSDEVGAKWGNGRSVDSCCS